MLALVQQPLVHGQLHILDLCSFSLFQDRMFSLATLVQARGYIYKRYNVVKPTIDPF